VISCECLHLVAIVFVSVEASEEAASCSCLNLKHKADALEDVVVEASALVGSAVCFGDRDDDDLLGLCDVVFGDIETNTR
jgi:hypothetical protein